MAMGFRTSGSAAKTVASKPDGSSSGDDLAAVIGGDSPFSVPEL